LQMLRKILWVVHRSLSDALKGSSRQPGRVPSFRPVELGGQQILADVHTLALPHFL